MSEEKGKTTQDSQQGSRNNSTPKPPPSATKKKAKKTGSKSKGTQAQGGHQTRQNQKRPRVSTRTPTYKRKMELHSDFSLRVYNRVYDHLGADIFTLVMKTQAANQREAQALAKQFIHNQFENLQAALNGEIERADILLDRFDVNELPTYGDELEFDAPYSTHTAAKFLDLIESMDQLLRRLDALMLNGLIEEMARNDRCYEWQRRLQKVAGKIRDVADQARSALRRINEGHEADLTCIAQLQQVSDINSESEEVKEPKKVARKKDTSVQEQEKKVATA